MSNTPNLPAVIEDEVIEGEIVDDKIEPVPTRLPSKQEKFLAECEARAVARERMFTPNAYASLAGWIMSKSGTKWNLEWTNG